MLLCDLLKGLSKSAGKSDIFEEKVIGQSIQLFLISKIFFDDLQIRHKLLVGTYNRW